MSDDTVKIEVNGQVLEARKGAMLIEVTDAAGIYIPRFCYHKKLSIAANCRMCLVEVARAPKPLAACATPVMDGMKVRTDSPLALSGQKGTMEFLLINHPLDCPICDQGGECELQDLAMGFGRNASRYYGRKRVVKDKDIGPLIETEMTRCIHCTRCVRFGHEIAHVAELGLTGRGEHTEIGTFIEKSLTSELSGNVIDLCPVGALTAKPSRYTGRSWEYRQHPGVSPHDIVGANVSLHLYQGRVMRVVPRENEAVNEVWLADRDRFSYEGLRSADRATQPRVDGEGTEWNTALVAAAERLRAVIDRHGADAVGVLAAPTATLEELYLLQKLARGLGIANLDHRLRQADFRDQASQPAYPGLGLAIAEMERLQAVLLIGSNLRMEQPLLAHRLRKAQRAGAQLMALNARRFDYRVPLAAEGVVDPAEMVQQLAGIARAVAELSGVKIPKYLKTLVGKGAADAWQKTVAAPLVNSERAALFLGPPALAHPALSQLRTLAAFIARHSGATLGQLPEGGNAVGAWLAGVLPHRGPGGRPAPAIGRDARALLETPRKAYLLLGVEPELDCWDTAAALAAVQGADCVLNLTPFASPITRGYSHILLPTGAFAETSGSFVNGEGRCQSVQGAIPPPGEARPAWKVLRVLGNLLNLPGFEYVDSQQVRDEVLDACAGVVPDQWSDFQGPFEPYRPAGLLRTAEVPIYAVDALVRRAASLQQTVLALPAAVTVHPELAREFGLQDGGRVAVRQNGAEVPLPVRVDAGVPGSCVAIPTGRPETAALGPAVGPVTLRAV